MQIADRIKIENILERIVFQIAENHYQAKRIIFVGIEKSGWNLAKEIIQYLNKIIAIETLLISLEIDKKKPESSPVLLSENLEGKTDIVILVDDVINSGKTLFYALRPFLDLKLNALQTLILVERKYKRFPISADFVGISLNTTMKEHIEVKVENNLISSIDLV